MKAICFDEIASPRDGFAALQLREVPVPEIGDDEVLVRMVCAAINPGDFLFIQNLYPDPVKPVFPGQIAGNHGAGIITKVGKNVSLQPGALVGFSYLNAWAEYAALPAEKLIPLPATYPIDKAAQYCNLITAWDLLAESKVGPGQWLVMTAGNSTIATMTLQFARRKGVKVISIVRRAQPDLDLKALGATEVIELSSLSGSVGERILEITQGQGSQGLIECVGGPLAGELIRSCAPGAQAIIYGGYSPERFELHNFDVLMKGLTLKAYVYRYFFTSPPPEDAAMLREIASLSASPEFRIHSGGMHPLEDFQAALHATLHQPERGKHFFRMSAHER